jgi:hypothetical protein
MLSALLAFGGAAIQHGGGDREGGRERVSRLAAGQGYLRVAASPWADVAVDGAHVEQTPFARSIPLKPGRHYVTLTHPDAPAEQRVVEIADGETVVVDVSMSVRDAGADA